MADDQDQDKDKPATGDSDTPARPLGDGGEKALREERAARREAEKQAKDMAARLKELEDREKSDGEKLADKVTAAEKRADEADARALRLEVAATKGLTAAQAKRLVGTSKEELEADADELLATFKPAEGDPADGDDKDADGDKPTPPTGRPTPDLKGGGGDPTNQDSGNVDLRKVVADTPRF